MWWWLNNFPTGFELRKTKIILPLTFFFFSSFSLLHAQDKKTVLPLTDKSEEYAIVKKIEGKRWTVGLSTGVMHYYGDIGNDPLPLSTTSVGYAATLRYLLNASFSVQLFVGYGHVRGDDRAKDFFSFTGQVRQRNYLRALSFRSHIFEVSSEMMYIFGNKNVSYHAQKIVPYLYAGVGMINFKPTADLFKGNIDIGNRYYFWSDGTIRDQDESTGNGSEIKKDGIYETALRDWRTEGQTGETNVGQSNIYKYMQLTFPIGMGVKIKLSQKFDLNIDLGLRYTLTDYLDDVSSHYVDSAFVETYYLSGEDQQLVYYISNPSNYIPPDSSNRRGNNFDGASRLDLYSYTSIGIAYKFGKKAFRESFDWINPITEIYRNVLLEQKKIGMISEKMKDKDKDGVADTLDRCPFTPLGVKVDAFGCPLDTDGDEVPDYRDLEANTPRGQIVNFQGVSILFPKVEDNIRTEYVYVYIDRPVTVENVPLTFELSGIVMDEENKNPLPGSLVTIIDKDANIREVQIKTDENGFYKYILAQNKNYSIAASQEGYLSSAADISTVNKTEKENMKADLLLPKLVVEKVFRLSDIYYDFNSAMLRSESKTELDKLVSMLNENPTIKIELGSHTDNIGSDESNQKLSEARAKSVVDYLIAHRISQNRLTYKGYGESKPIALNTNPDGSDNPTGRQMNRRTEFKIVSTDFVPESINFVVEPGNTLYSVAKNFGMTIDELKSLNGLTSNIISIGQILKVKNTPQKEEKIKTQTPPIIMEVQVMGKGYTSYTVRTGDTLFFIARQFKISVEKLKQINGLTDSAVFIGQTLKVPQKK